MPSSFVDSVPPIMKLLIENNPRAVVDIGPGWGKYGLMCREYLQGLQVLDAVEVTQGRKPTQEAIYDTVYEGDARDLPPDFWGDYSVALLIDVIEHMTLAEGKLLLRRIREADCAVLVSTPKEWMEQFDDHNPFEEHVSHWTWRDFPAPAQDVSTIDSLIFYITAT